jgi:hypothetical protein
LAATLITSGNFCGYRQVILQTDLDPDTFGVIVSPAMQDYLDTTQWATYASYSIWEKIQDGHSNRCLVGNEINTNTSMSSGKNLFAGLWRFLFIMLWGDGVEVQFDPVTNADVFQTVLRANLLCNIGITQTGCILRGLSDLTILV